MSLTHFPNGIRSYFVEETYTEIIVNTTLNATTDLGKTFYVTAPNIVITLPALSAGANYLYTIVNGCPDGSSLLAISPNSSDGISYLTKVDDKDLLNTAATSKRGDRVVLANNDLAVFWVPTFISGIWAKEG